MQNIRSYLVATVVGICAFTGMARPVYAQKIFEEAVPDTTQLVAPDSDLKKVIPLAFSTPATTDESLQPTDSFTVFKAFTFDTSSSSQATVKEAAVTEKTMPLDQEDIIGMSTQFSRFHPGIDLRAKVGTPIHAVLSGMVNEVGYEAGGYGRYVVLVHHVEGKTFFSLYAHMKETLVEVGHMVNSGDLIGEVGLTGHTTGPHLHFEVHDGQNAIDPLKFFAIKSVTLAKK